MNHYDLKPENWLWSLFIEYNLVSTVDKSEDIHLWCDLKHQSAIKFIYDPALVFLVTMTPKRNHFFIQNLNIYILALHIKRISG